MTASKGSVRSTALLTGGILVLAVALSLMAGAPALGVDHRYDCDSDRNAHPGMWDALNNYTTGGGHYMALGTDALKSTVNAKGNYCAEDWELFNADYPDWVGRAWEYADHIVTATQGNWPSGIPTWFLLNEISASRWPNDSAYRQWCIQVCYRLNSYHGRSVCLFVPFQTLSSNNADWQSLTNWAFVGDECYLSGEEIRDNGGGYSTSWCQTQYQNSKDSYTARGIPSSRVFLLEFFGHTVSGTGWGRAGLTQISNWQLAIQRRSAGSHNVGFNGFVSYSWNLNTYGATEQGMIDAATTYGSCLVK